jgi:hypothetical protein
VPTINNIHQSILEAVKGGDALEMGNWHTDEKINSDGAHCGTTHCRAGWVVALAGKEGRDLELQTSTEFAANVIYSKSSTIEVGPYHFYLSNDQSMADIEICATLEKEGKTERPN